MSEYPSPSITVDVDVTNPGEYFACCGLLELVDRIWPNSESWFNTKSGQFHIAKTGSFSELLNALSSTHFRSSLADEELVRLGTLLSQKKSTLTEQDQVEKLELRSKWRQETLQLCFPFDIHLDWWRDSAGDRTELKTWAAKQFILKILRPMLKSLRGFEAESNEAKIFNFHSRDIDSTLYFDSSQNEQGTPIDTGFSAYDLRRIIRTNECIRPAIELFAFIGMQRFKPEAEQREGTFIYWIWQVPLTLNVACMVTNGMLKCCASKSYSFRLLDRSEYMKAFLPARPLETLHEQ